MGLKTNAIPMLALSPPRNVRHHREHKKLSTKLIQTTDRKERTRILYNRKTNRHTSHQPLALPTRKASQELPVAVAMASGAGLQEAALSSIQSLRPVGLFGIPWTAARQASLSITNPPELTQTHAHPSR